MRLVDLEPQFLRLEYRTETWSVRTEDGGSKEVTGPRAYYIPVNTPQEADGISFLCPKCIQGSEGKIGCHSVICWSPRVGADVTPGPGRWQLVGTGYENLTLFANPTSVQLNGGCNAHFTVSNGNVGFN